ncbi:acetyltransferase [Luedemannella flava]|uniref:Acetyltransferase n=1 Tax=Luedemannella flava TaxID=349316 RepID=A0ABP4YJZ7_9ACTN
MIVGAGGSGREALDVLRDAREHGADLDFLGFVDDGAPDTARLARVGAACLGPVSRLADLPGEVRYCVGIGDGATRRRVDEYATRIGRRAISLIHPAATVGRDVRLGDGAVLWPGAHVTTNVTTGRHVHVSRNSTVGHDAVIGDYVTIMPLVSVSGAVVLGDEVTMGTGATIIQGRTVGRGSVVGAGAAVVRDIPAGVVAVGVPAVARRAVTPAPRHPGPAADAPAAHP